MAERIFQAVYWTKDRVFQREGRTTFERAEVDLLLISNIASIVGAHFVPLGINEWEGNTLVRVRNDYSNEIHRTGPLP
jgi:hypothetical protein